MPEDTGRNIIQLNTEIGNPDVFDLVVLRNTKQPTVEHWKVLISGQRYARKVSTELYVEWDAKTNNK